MNKKYLIDLLRKIQKNMTLFDNEKNNYVDSQIIY